MILSPKKVLKSFHFALKGLWYSLKKEQNLRIELVFAVGVIAMMFIFDLTIMERVSLSMIIIAVLVLEIFNTIIERIVDMASPRLHPLAETIKNMTAGTVLITSIGAVIIGIIIFYPHIFG
ncbi:diacylglycerol kinase family protein [Patescibacteria group bacterium]|nr:MAG: diacylglycerol kinase family protein [Patescibacteria group bacterium]